MENKVGYAYISLEDYKQLILDNKKFEEYNKEIKNQYEMIENAILDKIYNNNTFYLDKYDRFADYYYNELVKKFKDYGYTSIDKINELIQKLVEKYKNEEGNEKENE